MAVYRTFLSRWEPSWGLLPAGSLVLYPRNPTWNDFGHQVLASINIKAFDGRCLTLNGFVVCLTGDAEAPVRASFNRWIMELEKEASGPLIPADFDEPRFVTLLSDDKTYRELAEWALSLEERMSILLAINDMNLARVAQTIPPELVDLVIADEAFTHGVMRTSSAYRAYSKGARYVSREVPPWIADARLDIAVEVQLKGFDAAHAADFTFAGEPKLVSDRIKVLIGKNGTGKSQLLKQLVGSLALQADPSGTHVFRDMNNSEFSASAATWQAIPNAVLVFSTDDEVVFPRKVRLDAPLDYWHFSLASRVDDGEPFDPARLPLGRAMLDLLRDDSKLLDKRRFDIFRDIVDPVLPLSLIHLPLKEFPLKVPGVITDESGLLWFPLENVPSGEQQQLYLTAAVDTTRDVALIDASSRKFPPSSGQRVYLRFASLALCVISQGSLIVLDEPETHLHPNFISEFMKLVHDLLTATSSIALVATHSPYVVREVPTTCVHVVQRVGNVPSMGEVHLKTLGASVSSISDAVFGDATATRFHRILAEKMSKQVKEVSPSEEVRVEWLLKHFGDELNAEMLSTIRFLMSQDADMAQAGGADA